MTQLLNIRERGWVPGAVYIGRKKNSMFHYGNPWKIGPHMTRDQSCDNYERWLAGDKKFKDVEPHRRAWILENVINLHGKKVLCFCVPKRCHGLTLKRLAKEAYEKQCIQSHKE